MTLSLAILLAWSFSPLDGAFVSAACGSSVSVGLKRGSEWSGVSLALPDGADRQRLVAFTLRNTGTNALTVTAKSRFARRVVERQERTLPAGADARLVFNLRPATVALPFALEGMRGYERAAVPADGADAGGAVDVFGRSRDGGSFSISKVVLASGESCRRRGYDEGTFFPFCDAYGQFVHDEWPGKVRSDEELCAAGRAEVAWLGAHAETPISAADRFGGWASGPQLPATGRFRVERLSGRWHLVDPDGRLFFSFGLAGVRRPPATKARGRERCFPATTAGTDGLVNFGARNLVRKYGADADGSAFVARVRARVRSWGFNTVANWSDPSVFVGAHVPYVDSFSVGGRKLKTPAGPIVDVFDPGFADAVAAAADRIAGRSARDPWCVGWFVDNELHWGGADLRTLARAAQAADDAQPAKAELRRFLAGRPSGSAELRSATDADLRAFSAHYAETYFRTVRAVLRERAPGTLYLGCRFAPSRTPAEVWAIAARYADVLSANVYRLTPDGVFPPGLDRPLLIGEFHFGALDRGLLHAGCVAAGTQAERAELFVRYVRRALALPDVVGAHWFLYQDQPLTGRVRDGECFQCGFVDVCDTPYAEMVTAARNLARTLYDTYGGKLK